MSDLIPPTTVSVPRLMTTQEAAKYLQISPKWFERDRWKGPTIPYAKVGRAVRYRAEDIIGLIERSRVEVSQ